MAWSIRLFIMFKSKDGLRNWHHSDFNKFCRNVKMYIILAITTVTYFIKRLNFIRFILGVGFVLFWFFFGGVGVGVGGGGGLVIYLVVLGFFLRSLRRVVCFFLVFLLFYFVCIFSDC